MRYKTAFRLALKVIGVWFFFSGLVGIPSSLVNIWYVISDPSSIGWPGSSTLSEILRTIGWSIGPFLQTGFGLYLFFGGKWIVNKAIPSNKPYCHECGYPIEGVRGNRCPECDTAFGVEAPTSAGAGVRQGPARGDGPEGRGT